MSRLVSLVQVFAVGFFIVPVVRWAMLLRANRAIEERNRARRLGAQLLQSGEGRCAM